MGNLYSSDNNEYKDEIVLSPTGNPIPKSHQMFIQDLYVKNKVVILDPIMNHVAYQQQTAQHIYKIQPNVGDTTEFNINDSGNIVSDAPLIMSSNNILANVKTKPVKNEGHNDQAYIDVGVSTIETLPKLNIQFLDHEMHDFRRESLLTTRSYLIHAVFGYLDEKEKGRYTSVHRLWNLAKKDPRILKTTIQNNFMRKILNAQCHYDNVELDNRINKLHRTELQSIFQDKSNVDKAIKASSNNKREHSHIIEYRKRFINEQVQIHKKFANRFQWRPFHLDYIVTKPLGYVSNLKIINDNTTIKYNPDFYSFIKRGNIFYEVEYDLENLRFIIIDNEIENRDHFEIAEHKIFYWFYNNDEMRFIFGSHEFDWIGDKYIFYLRNHELSKKNIKNHKYERESIIDFLLLILPTYCTKFIKDKKIYIIV
jgi:hypothetical protein